MSLLDVVAAHSPLHRESGREWSAPCFACGGRDRFRVWPDQGRWWCRGCGARGDLIDLLRLRDGLTFREACAALGVTPGERPRPQAAPREPAREPSAEWRGAVREVVEHAARGLWTPAGREALRYLRGRGLRDATIRAWGLGYVAQDRVGLLVPGPCVVIPWWIGSSLWQAKLRLLARRPGRPRYLPLTWCNPARRRATLPGSPICTAPTPWPSVMSAYSWRGSWTPRFSTRRPGT